MWPFPNSLWKWNRKYWSNTQAFFSSLDWISTCLCENFMRLRHPSQPGFECWKSAGGLLQVPGGMYYLTSQQKKKKKCQLSYRKGWTPLSCRHCQALRQGHWALQRELTCLSKVHNKGSRRKKESSSYAWVWWVYCHVFLKNEMMPPWRCFCACTPPQKIVCPGMSSYRR